MVSRIFRRGDRRGVRQQGEGRKRKKDDHVSIACFLLAGTGGERGGGEGKKSGTGASLVARPTGVRTADYYDGAVHAFDHLRKGGGKKSGSSRKKTGLIGPMSDPHWFAAFAENCKLARDWCFPPAQGKEGRGKRGKERRMGRG